MSQLRCLCIITMMLAYLAMASMPVFAAEGAQVTSVAEPAKSDPVAEPAKSDPVAEPAEMQRIELERRVSGKWDALIRKDFEVAYAFTSPAYRNLYSLNRFKSKFGGKVGWRRIEIADVAFNGDNAATVSLYLHFVYHPPQVEKSFNMRTSIQESWVRLDGQWWYVVED